MSKVSSLVILSVSFIVILGFCSSAHAKMLMLADFNTAEKPNNINGDFGAWDKDPEDMTQTCTVSFNKEQEPGQYSYKLQYDVDSPNPAYNGFWMKLEGEDFSNYGYLVLSVKGDEGESYTTQISLELKNQKGQVGKYLLKGITSEWKKFAIPLGDFTGLGSRKDMSEFVVVFDDIRSTKKKGVIYIDEIYVE